MLDKAVSSQNSYIWGSALPYVVHECSLHSDYISVWYGFTADFILGPFFFEQNTSLGHQRCFITGSRYCNLLQQCVIPTFNDSA